MQHFQREQFTAGLSPAAARNLFRASVTVVHIEIFSYCNRRCHYCPVSQVDRLSDNKILPDRVFSRIINDLKEVTYAGAVNLSLYNEPSADRPLLLRRVQEARAALPRVMIYINSNGDYLTADYLEALADAGLSRLVVTLHPP